MAFCCHADTFGYGTCDDYISRFPEDFMFQLTKTEMENLRSNFSTANVNPKSRVTPHAFTEQGIYGASSKDAGKKLCAINRIENTTMIHPVIDNLLSGKDKII